MAMAAMLVIPEFACGQHGFTDPGRDNMSMISGGRDSLRDFVRQALGPDQDLQNGYQYYEAYRRFKGDPYLPGDQFYGGSVTRKTREFRNLQLKYDCYAHWLVLEYVNREGAYNRFIITPDHTRSFTLGELYFRKTSLMGEPPVYYQVISEEPVTCYVHWYKELVPLSDDIRYPYEFSRPRAVIFVQYDSTISRTQSIRAFADLFPASAKASIRRYCRKNRFRFNNATPDDMHRLIHHTAVQLKTPEDQ